MSEYLRKFHGFLAEALEAGALGGGGGGGGGLRFETRVSAAMSGSLGGFEATSELNRRRLRFDTSETKRDRSSIEDIVGF